jgi:hypothetical protein
VARTLHLSQRFARTVKGAGLLAGSTTYRAMAATLRSLAASDTLPGPLDYVVTVAPVAEAWVRRVTGENLWLYYGFDDTRVFVRAVTRTPPVPIDE